VFSLKNHNAIPDTVTVKIGIDAFNPNTKKRKECVIAVFSFPFIDKYTPICSDRGKRKHGAFPRIFVVIERV